MTVFPDKFTLNADELSFYSKHTGIQDEGKLKEHITHVAERALEVYPYYCFRTFGFLRFRILRSIGYKRLLELGSTRKNAFFLDLGCCFGNDIRKAIEDGFPAENIIGSDLHADFWKFGHDLFNSNPSKFTVAFIPGNVFDSSFISLQPPLKTIPPEESISLHSLVQADVKSLNPLRGHLSAIHTSAFFHLFRKDEQVIIAKKLLYLLSPLPGSIIFGSQVGAHEPKEIVNQTKGMLRYKHSPKSWKDMWEQEVFDTEEKRVFQVEAGFGDDHEEGHWLWWIVTRL
ncbi:hypothetical protein BT96DRAFT_891834 [Gymnopus androsaceus JB14]|uniref:Methyltransferase domain-containing protein n=1 Tax=Gymnopus androsaceus JB14 TaxID=1447944 RepID=A0A6A4GL04_9AGAR|nr:hypothetical protein BT96DRAFT_891834 [Gymnopus androsaceus JB14]